MVEARWRRNLFFAHGSIMTTPSQAREIRRALAWRGGGQTAAQALTWAATLVVIRLLAPVDYGLVAMAGVVTGFLALLAGQGFAAALVRAPDPSRADVGRFLGLLVLVNAGLALIQLGVARPAAAWFGEPRVTDLLRATAVAYLLLPWIAVPTALAQRALDFRTPALVDLAGGVAGAAATLALAWAGFGVWALVAGQLVPLAVRAALWAAVTPWLVAPRFRLAGVADMARFGGAVTLNGVVWFFYAQADVAVAGRVLTTAEVGLYSTAFFLAALPVAKLVPALTEVGFSAYARLAHDRSAVANGFLKAVRLATLAAFPLFAGLAATAPIAIPVLLGPRWAGAVLPVQLLCAAMPFYAVANLFGPAVNALGRPRVQLGNALLGLLIMPPAFWFGATHAGALGLALAWALAYPLLFALSAHRSLGVIGAPPSALARAVAPAAIAAAIMAALVYAIAITLPPTTPALGSLVALGAASYAIGLRLAFPGRLRELVALVRPPRYSP